jgi:hypothetical protein
MQQEIISALVNHSHYLPAISFTIRHGFTDFLVGFFRFVLITRPTTTIRATILYNSLNSVASEGRTNFELLIGNIGEGFDRGRL